jgi:hypothetical protein
MNNGSGGVAAGSAGVPVAYCDLFTIFDTKKLVVLTLLQRN